MKPPGAVAGGRGWSPVCVVGVILALAIGLAGCGVPRQGHATVIGDVPYALLEPEPAGPSAPAGPVSPRPNVYFVHDQDVVPVNGPDTEPTNTEAAVRAVLDRLSSGPTDRERDSGLTTALGPDTSVKLDALDGRLARIDLAAGDQVPAPARVPLAVAQIVLTVTSVPGVTSVLLTRDGTPVELPLPGGALTDQPVSAQDYLSLTSQPAPTASG